MTNIFNALEHCLTQIENGADLESVLKGYPELAEELRPILKTAIKASRNQTAEPSSEAFKRGREKVMYHASQMKIVKPTPRRRTTVSIFSRFAISLAIALFFLMSGTGLLSASASALPGDRLYSVKRGWENVRLFLIFDSEARTLLEDEFENERLHEVNELLSQGANTQIQFVGVFIQANGMNYVSGVQVVLPVGMQIPASGDIVSITGFTNQQGWVDVWSVELLPTGATVPVGNPIEVINENEETESSSGSENEAVNENEVLEAEPQVVYYDIQGVLQVVAENELIINGLTVYLNNPEIEGKLCVGRLIQVSGYYESDGRFMVTGIIGAEDCEGNGNSNSNDNSNTNDSNSNTNSNNSNDDSNTNDDDSNDNSSGGNSGSGGGGGDDDGNDGDDD